MNKHRRTFAVIYRSRNGWRFRLVAGNGEVIAVSEAYATRWNAKRGALRVRPDAEVRA